MKYKVRIEDRIFEVEIQDLYVRPIVAVVDGLAIEVWPEGETQARPTLTSPSDAENRPAPPVRPAAPQPPPVVNGGGSTIKAPIPGVIVSISVKSGDAVSPGQELCVLEAMKMKNAIRASRAGLIVAVHVQIGQHVKHHDVLMEYGE